MDDAAMQDAAMQEEMGRSHSGPSHERKPASWVRTEDLECELWNAIAEDFSKPLCEVADYDDGDDPSTVDEEYADEEELRNSLFRQLADLRPELGQLLSASKAG